MLAVIAALPIVCSEALLWRTGPYCRTGDQPVERRGGRAAPKIQLVVALVLVPSVLAMIAAALIAYSEVLLAGF